MRNYNRLKELKTYGKKIAYDYIYEKLSNVKRINEVHLIESIKYSLELKKSTIQSSIIFLVLIDVLKKNDNSELILNDSKVQNKTVSDSIFFAFQEYIRPELDFNDLICYYYDYSTKEYKLSKRIDWNYTNIRDFLIELEFLLYDKTTKEYKILSSKLIKNLNITTTSQTKLDGIMRRKQEIGLLGEKFVLKFERARLNSDVEVLHIALKDVSAGYDIVSKTCVESKNLNRFIEVKTFTDNQKFYFSKNEIEVAKNLEGLYYLYLVDFKRISEPDYRPIIIKNPYKNVINNSNISKSISSISILLDSEFWSETSGSSN